MTDTTADEHAPDDALDPPAAAAAVTRIPYPTVTAGWLNLFAPLVLVSLALSIVALIVAVNADNPPAGVAAPPAAGAPATVLSAELSEWDFVFDAAAIAADTEVPVTFTNVGTIEHNFAVLAAGAEPADESRITAEMVIADLGDILPGETLTGTLDLAPATYLVVCLIPGHYTSGMFAPLTVAGA